MLDMPKDPAAWREEMTDQERRELELAKRARDAAVEQYNAVLARLKNRCIQRLRSKAQKHRDEGGS